MLALNRFWTNSKFYAHEGRKKGAKTWISGIGRVFHTTLSPGVVGAEGAEGVDGVNVVDSVDGAEVTTT